MEDNLWPVMKTTYEALILYLALKTIGSLSQISHQEFHDKYPLLCKIQLHSSYLLYNLKKTHCILIMEIKVVYAESI